MLTKLVCDVEVESLEQSPSTHNRWNPIHDTFAANMLALATLERIYIRQKALLQTKSRNACGRGRSEGNAEECDAINFVLKKRIWNAAFSTETLEGPMGHIFGSPLVNPSGRRSTWSTGNVTA
jgi:hypothetical protein